MENKLLNTILATTIAIICVATLLVPTISGMTEDTVVHNNLGHRATLVEDSSATEDELTIVLTYATPSITINGVSVDAPETMDTWFDVFISDEVGFLYQWKESNAVISHTTYSTSQNKGAVIAMTDDVTITVSGSTLTFSWSTFTVTRTIEWYSYLNTTGDHVNALMYTGMPLTEVYFNDISDVRGYTIGYNNVFSFVGTAVEVNKLNGNVQGGELTATYSSEPYASNDNIQTMSIGRNAGDYTIVSGTEITHPFSYVLPYEVTGESVLTDYSTLLVAIPLLVLASLVIGFIVVIKRD